MKKVKLASAIVLILAIVATIAIGCKSSTTTATAAAITDSTPEEINGKKYVTVLLSVLEASETSYDFGTISMKNGLVSKEFTVTNPTDKDVIISTLETSCMCTQAFIVMPDGTTKGPFGMLGEGNVPPANETVKAKESRVIRVTYNPNEHGSGGLGQADRYITLTDASGGKLQLAIKVLVTP